MNRKLQLLSVISLVVLLTACASSRRVDYGAKAPDLKVQSTSSVSVGVYDQRSYIVSGRKRPEFVGLQRAAIGDPYDVLTVSRRPMAQEMGEAIAKALIEKGMHAVPVPLAHSLRRDEAVQALDGPDGRKRLLITVVDWKSDVYGKTRTEFDLRAEVIDAAGTTLARNAISGRDSLDMVVLTSTIYTEVLPQYQKRKLEELLNHPAIIAALGPAVALPATPPTAPPTRKPGS